MRSLGLLVISDGASSVVALLVAECSSVWVSEGSVMAVTDVSLEALMECIFVLAWEHSALALVTA